MYFFKFYNFCLDFVFAMIISIYNNFFEKLTLKTLKTVQKLGFSYIWPWKCHLRQFSCHSSRQNTQVNVILTKLGVCAFRKLIQSLRHLLWYSFKITNFLQYCYSQYDYNSNLHTGKIFNIIFIDMLIYLKVLKYTLSSMKLDSILRFRRINHR